MGTQTVKDTRDSIFRELHVSQNISSFQNKLASRRILADAEDWEALDYDSTLFVLEECRYRNNTWFGLFAKRKRRPNNFVTSLFLTLSQRPFYLEIHETLRGRGERSDKLVDKGSRYRGHFVEILLKLQANSHWTMLYSWEVEMMHYLGSIQIYFASTAPVDRSSHRTKSFQYI